MTDDLQRRYAVAGFWLLVTYASLCTVAVGWWLYYETVVRPSPPVMECPAPSAKGTR
jgi:hypothetical protein